MSRGFSAGTLTATKDDIGSGLTKRCARCRNHSLRVQLKGHKRKCPFRHCKCASCNLITMRRNILVEEASILKKEEASNTLLSVSAISNGQHTGKHVLSSSLLLQRCSIRCDLARSVHPIFRLRHVVNILYILGVELHTSSPLSAHSVL